MFGVSKGFSVLTIVRIAIIFVDVADFIRFVLPGMPFIQRISDTSQHCVPRLKPHLRHNFFLMAI